MEVKIKTEEEYRGKLISVLAIFLLASIILALISWASSTKIAPALFLLANGAVPFILLMYLTSKLDEEGNYVHKRSALVGSIIGAVCAVWVPFLWMLFEVFFYSGGGVNFGLGFLLLAMPIFVPMAMGLGWHIGEEYWESSNESLNSTPKDGAN